MKKKVKVSLDFPKGVACAYVVDLGKPSVFFSVPQANNDEMIKYLNAVMNLLRIRQGGNFNTCIELEDYGVDIYGSHACEMAYFKPILAAANPSNIEETKKLFRNINFVSYAGGNSSLVELIEEMHSELLAKGFNDVQVESIMGQISLLQIVDYVDDSHDVFPYVTTTTIHFIQDDAETLKWFDYIMPSSNDKFSKAVFMEIDGRLVVLLDSFGVGALQSGMPRRFGEHYMGNPVAMALMSMCLIEAVSCKSDLSSVSFKDSVEKVLAKAFKCEQDFKAINLDLDSLSKEDMEYFRREMMGYITDYVCNKMGKNKDDIKAGSSYERDQKLSVIATKLSIPLSSINKLALDVSLFQPSSFDDEIKKGMVERYINSARELYDTIINTIGNEKKAFENKDLEIVNDLTILEKGVMETFRGICEKLEVDFAQIDVPKLG